MLRTIPAGARGIDYSYSKPPVRWIKEQGFSFVVRYIGGSKKKRLTSQERDALLEAGIGIILVWELSAERPTQGYQAGLADGKEARKQAKELGYPPGLFVICAVDTDTWSGNEIQIANYMQAFNAYLAPEYLFGLYGDTDAMALASQYSIWCNWHANAWKNPTVMAAHKGPEMGPHGYVIHVLQHKQVTFSAYGVSFTVDPNTVQNPIQAWFKDTVEPEPPTEPEIPEMNTALRVKVQGYENIFLIGAGDTIHLTPELNKYYRALGVPELEVAQHEQFMETVVHELGTFEWVPSA